VRRGFASGTSSCRFFRMLKRLLPTRAWHALIARLEYTLHFLLCDEENMMLIRNSGLALAGLSLTALGLVAMPLCAHAQDAQTGTDTSAEAAGPKIKLDLENADLYTALKLLFAQTKTQYTLAPELRNIFVTVHINQPFRNALETLLRASAYLVIKAKAVLIIITFYLKHYLVVRLEFVRFES
jgi:hypothetical protein